MKSRHCAGGVLAPRGFSGGVSACGIKSGNPDRHDLAIIFSSEAGTSAAGTFTQNRVKAAPVLESIKVARRGRARAVVLNSGNANACTGAAGLRDAREMARSTARRLAVSPSEVFVCSTGRIGIPLPMERIFDGVAAIRLSRSAGADCARAIMTSDKVPKSLSVQITGPTGTYRIGAMAKGAGMIDPNMATMLCVITTDAGVPAAVLQPALRSAVEDSFNRITVDGDMSTNDTVLALANGTSGAKPTMEEFREALTPVLIRLAQAIVRDGEGASRFITLRVSGAPTVRDARKAAEAVANSILVKTSWAGGDPNWGRLMDAIGYSGARFRPSSVNISYDGLLTVKGGQEVPGSIPHAAEIASASEFTIGIVLGSGSGSYVVWTTDLTSAYVKFNLTE